MFVSKAFGGRAGETFIVENSVFLNYLLNLLSSTSEAEMKSWLIVVLLLMICFSQEANATAMLLAGTFRAMGDN